MDETSSYLAPSSSAMFEDENYLETNLIQPTPIYEESYQLTSTNDFEYRSAALQISSALAEASLSSDIINNNDMLDGIVAQLAVSLLNLIESSSVADEHEFEMASSEYILPSSSYKFSSSAETPEYRPQNSVAISSVEFTSSKRFPPIITAFRPSDLRIQPTVESTTVTPALDNAIVSSIFEAILEQPTSTIQSMASVNKDIISSVVNILQQPASIKIKESIFSFLKPVQYAKSTVSPQIETIASPAFTLVKQPLFTNIDFPTASQVLSPPIQFTLHSKIPSASNVAPPIFSISQVASSFEKPIVTSSSLIIESHSTKLPHYSLPIKPLNKLPLTTSILSSLPSIIESHSTKLPHYSPPTKPLSKLPLTTSILSSLPFIATLAKPFSTPSLQLAPLSSAIKPSNSPIHNLEESQPQFITAFPSFLSVLPLISNLAKPIILTTISAPIAGTKLPSSSITPPATTLFPPPLTTFSQNIPSQIDKVTELLNIKDFSATRSNVNNVPSAINDNIVEHNTLQTPILNSPTLYNVITTGRQPPETLLQQLSSLFVNPTPTLLPPVTSTNVLIQNLIRPPVQHKPPTTNRPIHVKLTSKPTTAATTPEPTETFGFGEVRPIVLDLPELFTDPTLSSVWDGKPSIVPLRDTTVISNEPFTHDSSPSTHSQIFIRPTLSSSSAIRQTIFHTLVSFSDSSQQQIANDDQLSSDFITATKATTTRRPFGGSHSHRRTPTTRRRRTTTVASTLSTRRMFRPRRTTTAITTTRRPLLKRPTKPAQDDPQATTTKPLKPGQNLMAFGLSLLPAAVIAAIIGLPLAVGKKKREVSDSTSNRSNDWAKIRRYIDNFQRKYDK
ncbi:hypothetical protein CHUAL_003633 [Chamberlinius hualienensis]